MQTSAGKAGFRVEFNERSGACINTWVGKEKELHFEFQSSEKRVTKIPKHYCKQEHNFYDTQLIYELNQLLADNYFEVLESQFYIDLINNKYPFQEAELISSNIHI